MAIGDNRSFANALRGLEDFERGTLTEEDEEELEVVRPDDDSIRRSVQSVLSDDGNEEPTAGNLEEAANALGGTSAAEGASAVGGGGSLERATGADVEGETPVGVPEPEGASAVGNFLSNVGETLSEPSVQNFLAEMGIAFSQGRENEPGTILGKGVLRRNRGQAVSRVAGEMLEGKPLSEIDTSGLLPDDISTAVGLATQQQQQETREERTNIQQQRADIESRVTDLRERGLDLEEEGLELEGLQTESDIENAEAQVTLAEDRLEAENRMNEARIRLFDARARALEAEESDELNEAEQSQLNDQLLRTRSNVKSILDEERSNLEDAQADVDKIEGNIESFEPSGLEALTEGTIFEPLFARPRSLVEIGEDIQEELRGKLELAKDELEARREVVNSFESQLENIREELSEEDDDTSGENIIGEEDTDGGGDGDSESTGSGTRDDPISVDSDEEWRALDPGLFFEANGKLFRRRANGAEEL